jgi:hypothetical protein
MIVLSLAAIEIQFLAERTQRDRSIDLTQGSGVLSGNWWDFFHAHWTEANRAPHD